MDADGTLLECSPMFMEDLSFFDLDTSVEHQKVGMIAAKPDPDEEVHRLRAGSEGLHGQEPFQGRAPGPVRRHRFRARGCHGAATDAVGGENVYGISMPSMYSSDGSKDDAADLARNIGAVKDIQPIEPLFVSFQNQLELEGVAAENCRHASAASSSWPTRTWEGLLAVATGNKSELAWAIPQSTAMAGGYAPIKDLLKTRVWEISPLAQQGCRRRHGHRRSACRRQRAGSGHCAAGWCDDPRQLDREGAVRRIAPRVERIPDLLPEYALLDQVLAMYIEHAHGRADLLADGFDEATVDTVMRLVDRAEWKRRQYPLGPKVTALAFGRDRRLPVTNAFRE